MVEIKRKKEQPTTQLICVEKDNERSKLMRASHRVSDIGVSNRERESESM